MGYETIRYEAASGVAKIMLNRPDKLNAFNKRMHRELREALKEAEKSADVRVILLTGVGKAFSAGQDLEEVTQEGLSYGEVLRERYNPLILQMHRIEKPIIAAVNGVAGGAGMSLALASDIRLVSSKASFADLFILIGLVPDSGGTYFLPRIVGLGKALELAFTGEKIAAEEAVRIGLANALFPEERFPEETFQYAAKMASSPTKGIGLIKRGIYRALDATLEESLEYEAYLQEIAGGTEDHKEGVKAFYEKRKPQFIGR